MSGAVRDRGHVARALGAAVRIVMEERDARTGLPVAVAKRLQVLCLDDRSPAYALVGEHGAVRDAGGAWNRYASATPSSDAPIGHQVDYLEGLLPLDGQDVHLPFIQVDDEVYADVHLFPGEGGDWVLLLDATPLANRLFDMQQNTNELTLIRRALSRALVDVQKHREELRAVLNQLELVTLIVDGEEKIEFASESAEALLHTSPADLIGKPWAETLPFSSQDIVAIRELMNRPPDKRERFSLQVESQVGRHFALDIDVQDDPRLAANRILYLYDVTEVHGLRRLLREKTRFHDIVGGSPTMAEIFERIEDVARVDATVLIQGETGTGKELAARAIHFTSPRSDKPFIVVNSAGLSDSLINSQLFGHKKGSFTDAVADQEGFFEAADGGTILLDEIGDIPANTQTRILRVLEQKEVIRIGETRPRKVDVRILAATNRDLEAEVKAGNFRADLFFRLRVARVTLPPLRDRRDDIPLLVEAFLTQAVVDSDKAIDGMDHDAMRRLVDYDWPGNVRELKNAIAFAVIHGKGNVLKADDLPPEVTATRSRGDGRRDYDSENERDRILAALEQANGKRDEAAKILGIGRATLYRRMKECLLDPADIPKRGQWRSE